MKTIAKKLISCMLVLVMCLSLLPAGAFAQDAGSSAQTSAEAEIATDETADSDNVGGNADNGNTDGTVATDETAQSEVNSAQQARVYSASRNGEYLELVIEYYYETDEGQQISAAPVYKASMLPGSEYSVESPSIPGYKLQDSAQQTVRGTLKEPTTVQVLYIPAEGEAGYTINYILRNIDGTGEKTTDTVIGTAAIGAVVQAEDKTISGYVRDPGQMDLVVTQDGNATLNIYYTQALNPYIVFSTGGSDVALLFDDIIENNNAGVSNTELLKDKADEAVPDQLISGKVVRHYQLKYLDLVDRNNGNVWVAADQKITVYWPLPEGTDKDTQFALVHFPGLHREMGVDEVKGEIENCDTEKVEIQNNGTHITFTVDRAGFSPFVLIWEEPKPDKPDNPKDPETPAPSATPQPSQAQDQPAESETETVAAVIPATSDPFAYNVWVIVAVCALIGLGAAWFGKKYFVNKRNK